MTISELIEALQTIDKTVPFDSDVVTGDEWMPSEIVSVFHKPPYTFLEFRDELDEAEEDNETQEKTNIDYEQEDCNPPIFSRSQKQRLCGNCQHSFWWQATIGLMWPFMIVKP